MADKLKAKKETETERAKRLSNPVAELAVVEAGDEAVAAVIGENKSTNF